MAAVYLLLIVILKTSFMSAVHIARLEQVA